MSKPFELGVCMAGAVSAGAYTAGAMDFLMEALQTWEDHRGEPGVPAHEVVIKAIGGASAGGMTGIIAATVLNNPIAPVTKLNKNNLFEQRPDNKFYHAWVDLLEDDMFPRLLGTDDMEKGKIYSLFNSKFIDEVGDKSLQVDAHNRVQRAYVDEFIKIFVTLTNVEGFKYSTRLTGAMSDNDYHLSYHADYATFILNKAESDYDNDGWIPLDFFNHINTNIALDAAMATGAFPVGLRSRKILRKTKYVNDLDWNHPPLKLFPLKGNVKSSPSDYEALIIDGGTLNNEPFEKVKSLVNGINPDEKCFEGTTLMIDPFPSYAETFDIGTDGLSSMVGKTLSAMMGHLRSKPEVLEKIYMHHDDVSQYQIAPVRYNGTNNIEGSKAIACGFMGGFGGFIHKEFRIHDFFLGRANCEHFLREYFTVDANSTNPIFENGYQGIDPGKFLSSDGRRQIIPVFTPKQSQMYMPTFEHGGIWPTRKEAEVDRFEKALKRRVGAMVMNVARYNWIKRLCVGACNRIFLRKPLAKKVLKSIKSAMAGHDLL